MDQFHVDRFSRYRLQGMTLMVIDSDENKSRCTTYLKVERVEVVDFGKSENASEGKEKVKGQDDKVISKEQSVNPLLSRDWSH